jgi:hypothetical protein
MIVRQVMCDRVRRNAVRADGCVLVPTLVSALYVSVYCGAGCYIAVSTAYIAKPSQGLWSVFLAQSPSCSPLALGG